MLFRSPDRHAPSALDSYDDFVNSFRSTRLFVLAAVACAVALLVPPRASAHDLKATVNPEVDPIRVEAAFDDDTPADGARVAVIDGEGNTIAAGVLDEKGVWSFAKPGPGTYRIVVELPGHRDVVFLEVPEAAPPIAIARWRLDKDLGLAIGLVLLLGGTLLYVLLRGNRRANARTATAVVADEVKCDRG